MTVVAGTYVTQLLRDDFGAKATLANAVVWPHNAGEVIVQNYNSLLTVSHLAQVRESRPWGRQRPERALRPTRVLCRACDCSTRTA